MVRLLYVMPKRDLMRWGMSVGEAGWRLGITRRAHVAIEDGERPPNSIEYEAICEFFGWPDARRGDVSLRSTRRP